MIGAEESKFMLGHHYLTFLLCLLEQAQKGKEIEISQIAKPDFFLSIKANKVLKKARIKETAVIVEGTALAL